MWNMNRTHGLDSPLPWTCAAQILCSNHLPHWPCGCWTPPWPAPCPAWLSIHPESSPWGLPPSLPQPHSPFNTHTQTHIITGLWLRYTDVDLYPCLFSLFSSQGTWRQKPRTYLFSESAGGCSSPSGFSSVTFDWSSSLQKEKDKNQKVRHNIYIHFTIWLWQDDKKKSMHNVTTVYCCI